jgi:hypothetical protein
MKMKKLFFGAAFVALSVSPVLAHGYQRVDGATSTRMMHQLRGVKAQAIAPVGSVYFNSRVIGTDPDPNVQLSFQRDPEPWNR